MTTTRMLSAESPLSTFQGSELVRQQTAELAAAVSPAEGDRICSMVLGLVQHLSAHPSVSRRLPESTGAAYAPAMAPWVEKRSDERRR